MANLVLNGRSIDSLDEIAENFVDEDVVKVFENGVLVDWLDEFGYDDEAGKIREITSRENIISDVVKALGLDESVVESTRAKILNERAIEKEKAIAAVGCVEARNRLGIYETKCGNSGLENSGDMSKEDESGLYVNTIDPSKCISCGTCQSQCPAEAIEYNGNSYAIDVDRCVGCGCCKNCCPIQAIYERYVDEDVSSFEESVVYDELWYRIVNILAEWLQMNWEQITPNSNIVDDLGADSLDAIELVMVFEEEFMATIPEEDAERLTTPGKIYTYLRAKGYGTE